MAIGYYIELHSSMPYILVLSCCHKKGPQTKTMSYKFQKYSFFNFHNFSITCFVEELGTSSHAFKQNIEMVSDRDIFACLAFSYTRGGSSEHHCISDSSYETGRKLERWRIKEFLKINRLEN